MPDMKRREFIALLGGGGLLLAAKVKRARGQQPAMPVIGFLNPSSADGWESRLRAFRQGLKDEGFVEGENMAVEYRWAENQFDRLPALAVELVHRQVAVIVTTGSPVAALAAKAATTTIPVVFGVPEDPVRSGLVASLARPGGNATGINFFSIELVAKRLEILREMVPATTRIAVLINPADAAAETMLKDVKAATRVMGLQIQVLNANTSHEIDAAFATFVRERPDALFVSGGPLLLSRRVQLALLAARHAVPASYGAREYVEIGGLMSYGANVADAYRQVGVYAGRILKGAKPADLPVMQSTKFELVINAQSARVLGLTVPDSLLARADEVIE
jgi:putative tryptophan/tyrosine transport system substrate-binding protein